MDFSLFPETVTEAGDSTALNGMTDQVKEEEEEEEEEEKPAAKRRKAQSKSQTKAQKTPKEEIKTEGNVPVNSTYFMLYI